MATTGRFLVTFKEGATDAGIKHLESKDGLRLANARDFEDQAAVAEEVGDADGLVFPEIGVVLMGGEAAAARGMTAEAEIADRYSGSLDRSRGTSCSRMASTPTT